MTPSLKRTLFGINAGIALAHIGNFIYFPHLVSTLGVTYSGFWAGFVMFMTYVGRLSATFCYEGFAARTGLRNSIVAGIAVEAVALGLMAYAEGVAFYSLLAFFVGFGSGLSFPGLKNILGTFPEADRPKAFSSFQMACQLGAIAGALIGGIFTGAHMATVFAVVFGLFMLYCLAAFFFIPSSPATNPGAPLVNTKILSGLQAGNGTQYFLLSSLFWFLSINFIVGMPLHMQAYVKEIPLTAPFWITGICILILQYPLFRFFNQRFQPGTVMAVAFAGMACAYLLFGAGITASWVVLGCFLVIVGDILFTPSFDLWVSAKIPSDRLAKAMGAMHFFRSFGNMVGTFMAGLLFDLSRHVAIPGINWYIVAAIASSAAVFSYLSGRRESEAATALVAQKEAG
ncbi:MFS transporter [Chitinimonas prasina]|uniref:MFS transporter n=1 Tax=Chitinimonas prasina TaxID=1434937 RepID=A0ABQ5YBM3_9NEIS|nr:MFS transporter [Chitinimonas prasina]GLR12189.1 MFS transporter [Chitinimonas prasina]